MSAARLVFVDESGANTQMTRRYGRSPIGQRLVCPVPQGHYQTTTLIAAVRLDGPQAPWLFDGPLDGQSFLAWVQVGCYLVCAATTWSSWTTWPRTR